MGSDKKQDHYWHFNAILMITRVTKHVLNFFFWTGNYGFYLKPENITDLWAVFYYFNQIKIRHMFSINYTICTQRVLFWEHLKSNSHLSCLCIVITYKLTCIPNSNGYKEIVIINFTTSNRWNVFDRRLCQMQDLFMTLSVPSEFYFLTDSAVHKTTVHVFSTYYMNREVKIWLTFNWNKANGEPDDFDKKCLTLNS